MIDDFRAEPRFAFFPEPAAAIDSAEADAECRWPSDEEDDTGTPAHAEPLLIPPAKKRRLRRPNAGFLALSGLCLALMAALGLRDRAVRAVPPLAGAYAAIGLPVNLRGLEIRALKSSLVQDDSGSVLTVEGQIVNIRPHTVPVPQVRIGVEGADGQEIYTWTAATPKPRLASGETIAFRARLTTPPKDAHAVLVRFAAKGE